MHPNASAWDKEHKVDTSISGGDRWPEGKQIPTNRPCDRCGEPVDRGFIHVECLKAEKQMWIDLLT